MKLAFTTFPESLFFLVFVLAIGILLYTFGALIVKERRFSTNTEKENVAVKQIDSYLRNKGYVVYNLTPIKNSNKWLAFLVKNGKYLTATVNAKEGSIEENFELVE